MTGPFFTSSITQTKRIHSKCGAVNTLSLTCCGKRSLHTGITVGESKHSTVDDGSQLSLFSPLTYLFLLFSVHRATSPFSFLPVFLVLRTIPPSRHYGKGEAVKTQGEVGRGSGRLVEIFERISATVYGGTAHLSVSHAVRFNPAFLVSLCDASRASAHHQ